MKIAIAADKGGFALKESLLGHLSAKGHEVTDVGMKEADKPVWWHEGCRAAVKLLQDGKVENAILICGSGAGMAMLANKHEGRFRGGLRESLHGAPGQTVPGGKCADHGRLCGWQRTGRDDRRYLFGNTVRPK